MLTRSPIWASGLCNIALEKWDEAQKDLETSANQDSDWAKAMLVHFYMKNGNQLQAQKLYDELASPTRYWIFKPVYAVVSSKLFRKKRPGS